MPKAILNYIIIFLLVGVLGAQIVTAIPDTVQNYCEGFDQDECGEHFEWFEHPDCKVQVRCVTEIDFLSVFRFKGCKTTIRFDVNDCESNPSVLCFNNVAYDISKSETCSEGGVRFRELDSCGNTLDWGRCIDIESCETVIKTPYTGTAIPVRENCAYLDAEPVDIEPQQNNVIDDSSDEDDDDDDDRKTSVYYGEIREQQKTVEQVIQEVVTTADAETETKEEIVLIPTSGNRRIWVDRKEESVDSTIILILAGYTAALLLIIVLGVVLYRKRR